MASSQTRRVNAQNVAFAIALGASPVAADDNPASLSRCEVEAAAQTMDCDVENVSGEAIAGLEYDLLLMEGDRTVPWGVSLGSFQVPGGIEPGEVKRLTFKTQGLPPDGWSQALYPVGPLVALPWQVGGVETDTRPIPRPNRPAANPGQPMTGAEKYAFRVALQGCWVVDPGAQAAGVTVTIVFELDRQGRLIAGPDLLTSSGGTPEVVNAAFESASRAVTRCSRDGFDLPAEKYEQWRVAEMTFDPSGMRLR